MLDFLLFFKKKKRKKEEREKKADNVCLSFLFVGQVPFSTWAAKREMKRNERVWSVAAQCGKVTDDETTSCAFVFFAFEGIHHGFVYIRLLLSVKSTTIIDLSFFSSPMSKCSKWKKRVWTVRATPWVRLIS